MASSTSPPGQRRFVVYGHSREHGPYIVRRSDNVATAKRFAIGATDIIIDFVGRKYYTNADRRWEPIEREGN